MLGSGSSTVAGDFTVTFVSYPNTNITVWSPGLGTELFTLTITATGAEPSRCYRVSRNSAISTVIPSTELVFAYVSSIGFLEWQMY
jgi:hypothetical protein